MAKRTYEFSIAAKIDEAIRSVDKLTDGTQTKLDGINFKTAVSAINDGFSLIERTAGRAFDFIASNVGEFIDAAALQEEAVNKLNTSLALAGEFSQEASRSIQEFAREIQNTTTV